MIELLLLAALGAGAYFLVAKDDDSSGGGSSPGVVGPTEPGGKVPSMTPEQDQFGRSLWELFCSQTGSRKVVPTATVLARDALRVLMPANKWPPGVRADASIRGVWKFAQTLAKQFRRDRKKAGECPPWINASPTGPGPGSGPPTGPVPGSGGAGDIFRDAYRGYQITLEWLSASSVQWTVDQGGIIPPKGRGTLGTADAALAAARAFIDARVGPVDPTDPPTEPVGPLGPVDPLGPVGPTDPTDPPTEPVGPVAPEPLTPAQRVIALANLTRATPTAGYFYQVKAGDNPTAVARAALKLGSGDGRSLKYMACIAAHPINVRTGTSQAAQPGEYGAGESESGAFYKMGGFANRYENAEDAVAGGRWWDAGGGRFGRLWLPPAELVGSSSVICDMESMPSALVAELGAP